MPVTGSSAGSAAPETPRTLNRTGRVQVLATGVNAWFVAAGFPWLATAGPSRAQTFGDAAPLVLLLTAVAVLSLTKPTSRRQRFGTWLLIAGFPASLGIATAVRDEDINQLTLPGPVLLSCVLSLWLFMAAAARATQSNAPPHDPTAVRRTPAARAGVASTLIRALVICAASALTTLAPTWIDATARTEAWGDALHAGGALTAAFAAALAVAAILIALGPGTHLPQPPPRGSLRARVLPPLIAAAFGFATYLFISGQ